jgi:hypothetical protein
MGGGICFIMWPASQQSICLFIHFFTHDNQKKLII